MAKQTVDTDQLHSAAERLRAANDNINGYFDTMKRTAVRLQSEWRGAAASAAHSAMYQLFQNNEVRSNVLQNYVNLLEQQVEQGYFNAEEANTSLSDMFK